MHFVYPSHPLQPAKVEPVYADEITAMRAAGFSTSVCPDAVINDGKPIRNVPVGAQVIYRGWMLNASGYQRLFDAINAVPATPLTSAIEYLTVHHCPNWYPLLADFTPETRVYPVTADLESEMRRLGWGQFFVKDYVKSLKTSRGSIVRDPAEIDSLLLEMKRFRGEIEGGICLRRVEAFVTKSERRFFVIRGVPFSAEGEVPDLVRQVAAMIPSPFFSVDVVRREDGILRVVEVGDGQVSDLVGWSPERFVEIWVTAMSGSR